MVNATKCFSRKQLSIKKNIVVSGATGSGKTTFMKALVNHIPLHERLISIEDARELFYSSPECCSFTLF